MCATHLIVVNILNTAIHNWSVMCGMPDRMHACNWGPWRVRNLVMPSSVRLSDESKSNAMRLRAGAPASDHALSTESLKPLFWPADRNRKVGMRVSISMRHSVDKSVAVISSSSRPHLSHSTCITYSDFRPGELGEVNIYPSIWKMCSIYLFHS